MKAYNLVMLLCLVLLLAGCSSVASKNAQTVPQAGKILKATGFSQFNDNNASASQRWQQAQQDAKLDAYRDLAVLLYQEPVGGNTTVGQQVVRDEAYRIYVDTYLREAQATDYRVVRENLKATLELKLSPRFFRCMSGSVSIVGQCLQEDNKLAFTRLGFKPAAKSSSNLACASADCGDMLHVQGFSKDRNVVDDALLDAGLYDSEWLLHTGINIFLLTGAQYGF